MPKTLARSVIASAGMPSAAARSTASSMRTMPSVIENSLWSRRWTKAGFGIWSGLGAAKFYHRTLLRNRPVQRLCSRGKEKFHDRDQRYSRAPPRDRHGRRASADNLQVPEARRRDRVLRFAGEGREADRSDRPRTGVSRL